MKIKACLIIAVTFSLCVAAVAWTPNSNAKHLLKIHEWGTFTVLQDESGAPVPGVNINEESLPKFVHELSPGLSPDAHKLGPLLNQRLYQGRPMRSKGIARFNPAVIMRMETPIIYFHLPEDNRAPRTLDIEVAFRNGWISEWYPDAKSTAPGFSLFGRQEPISSKTVGRIAWNGITVGETEATLPETDEHVWLAPRNVVADPVKTAKGQAEKYLFYRGVANMEAPLRVRRSKDGKTLNISQNESLPGEIGSLAFPHLWLADIRPDGTTAFRVVDGIDLKKTAKPTETSIQAGFSKKDYSKGNLKSLRAAMRTAIIEDGLFPDEADALLNTWEASYFKSEGLRLFFLLPQKWTDAVLPITVSEPAEIERVMVGRIELVTPEQRELLQRIGKVSGHDQQWFTSHYNKMPTKDRAIARAELLSGKKTLEDYGFKVPPSYKDYMAIGRFRDALVVNEVRRNRNESLAAFARTYGIRYFLGW